MNGFVTYAQNFEDLMLWRALSGVQDGFYIDVGAADPEEDSVTRAFYDRGWHGVNIEPSPEHFNTLSAGRPRDINLCCLVGVSSGDMNLYNIPDTGLSTVERDLAERHATEGYPADGIIRLPVRTLTDICREFAPSDIHFLKIDVEGAEADVLRGADFAAYRPWIVLVEATIPLSQAENWEDWDPLLIQADYSFVWFDGLNRFYLASERIEGLQHAFRTPPNVFDGWIRPRGQQQMALLRRGNAIQDAMDRLREETARARANIEAEAAAARAEAQGGRLEAMTVRTEVSAVKQEAAAARAEMSTLRTTLSAAQQDASTVRGENAALQSALTLARQDASTVRSENAALQSALTVARQDASTVRGEKAALQLALTVAQEDAGTAQAAIERLGGAQQAREHAEALVAALRASTSWRVTAPLRMVSRGLQSLGSDPARRDRLRMVAGLGQGPAGAKGVARIVVYGLGRLMTRAPAGQTMARLLRAVAPGPYRWLHRRYLVYLNAAIVSKVVKSVPPDCPALATPLPLPQDQNDMSAEERVMLLRLRAREDAA